MVGTLCQSPLSFGLLQHEEFYNWLDPEERLCGGAAINLQLFGPWQFSSIKSRMKTERSCRSSVSFSVRLVKLRKTEDWREERITETFSMELFI